LPGSGRGRRARGSAARIRERIAALRESRAVLPRSLRKTLGESGSGMRWREKRGVSRRH